MAFTLRGFLTIDPAVLALYDVVAPGGAEQAAPTAEPGLPDGWVLRWLADLAEPGSASPDWQNPATIDGWAQAAGLPPVPVPPDAFSLPELQFASLLSLAAPAGVLLLDDLPRQVSSSEVGRRPLQGEGTVIPAEVVSEWSPYFPILRRVSS